MAVAPFSKCSINCNFFLRCTFYIISTIIDQLWMEYKGVTQNNFLLCDRGDLMKTPAIPYIWLVDIERTNHMTAWASWHMTSAMQVPQVRSWTHTKLDRCRNLKIIPNFVISSVPSLYKYSHTFSIMPPTITTRPNPREITGRPQSRASCINSSNFVQETVF